MEGAASIRCAASLVSKKRGDVTLLFQRRERAREGHVSQQSHRVSVQKKRAGNERLERGMTGTVDFIFDGKDTEREREGA